MFGLFNNKTYLQPPADNEKNILCLTNDMLRFIFNKLKPKDLFNFLQANPRLWHLMSDPSHPLTFEMLNHDNEKIQLDFNKFKPYLRRINYLQNRVFQPYQDEIKFEPSFYVPTVLIALAVFCGIGYLLTSKLPSAASAWSSLYLMMSTICLAGFYIDPTAKRLISREQYDIRKYCLNEAVEQLRNNI